MISFFKALIGTTLVKEVKGREGKVDKEKVDKENLIYFSLFALMEESEGKRNENYLTYFNFLFSSKFLHFWKERKMKIH